MNLVYIILWSYNLYLLHLFFLHDLITASVTTIHLAQLKALAAVYTLCFHLFNNINK